MKNYYPEDYKSIDLSVVNKKNRGRLAERQVFEKLINLFKNDPEYFIRWDATTDSSDYYNIQIDILIFRKGYGFLNLEIKDWQGNIKSDSNGLLRQERGSARDVPSMQADKVLMTLNYFLDQHSNNPISSDFRVLFISTDRNNFDTQYLKNKDKYWTKEIFYDDQKFKGSIVEIFEKSIKKQKETEKIPDSKIVNLLKNKNLKLVIEIENYRRSREEIIKKTKVIQKKFIEDHFKYPNWLTFGEAGTGKTYVALQVAEKCIKEGKKGLFIIFNGIVNEWINEIKKEFKLPDSKLEICTIQSFLKKHTNYPSVMQPQSIIPNAQIQELKKGIKSGKIPKFDFLILDEMQDIEFSTIEVLREGLNDPDSGTYLFLDPKQDLSVKRIYKRQDYKKEIKKMIPSIKELDLKEVVRSSKNIYEEVKDKSKIWTANCKNSEGLYLDEVETKSYDLLYSKTIEYINKLKTSDIPNFKLSDIIILGNKKFEYYFKKDTKKGSRKKISSNNIEYDISENIDRSRINDVLQFRYIQTFKGCESDFVLLWWAGPYPPKDKDKTTYYIGGSRAKIMLNIIKFKKPGNKGKEYLK